MTLDFPRNKKSDWSWLCGIFFIGHNFHDAQPEKLKNSPHRRVQCGRCEIIRWRFTGESYDEIESIFAGAKKEQPVNRAQKRAYAQTH